MRSGGLRLWGKTVEIARSAAPFPPPAFRPGVGAEVSVLQAYQPKADDSEPLCTLSFQTQAALVQTPSLIINPNSGLPTAAYVSRLRARIQWGADGSTQNAIVDWAGHVCVPKSNLTVVCDYGMTVLTNNGVSGDWDVPTNTPPAVRASVVMFDGVLPGSAWVPGATLTYPYLETDQRVIVPPFARAAVVSPRQALAVPPPDFIVERQGVELGRILPGSGPVPFQWPVAGGADVTGTWLDVSEAAPPLGAYRPQIGFTGGAPGDSYALTFLLDL